MLRTSYLRLDDDLVPFLESGCALVLGSVAPDGAPFATRGWGLDVDDAAAGRIRVLLLAAELPTLGSTMAVTSTSVRTLRSLQMKGAVVELEPAVGDEERYVRYCDGFFGDLHDSDGTPMAIIDRLRPVGPLGAAHVVVDELFDQTPGPAAGTAVGR
jgi:hypothetical protein